MIQEMEGSRERATPSSRTLALLVGAAMGVPCVAVSLTALHLPGMVAILVAVLVVAAGVWIASAKAPSELASLARHGPVLFALWLLLSVAAVYRITTLAFFMADASRVEQAFQRDDRAIDDPALTRPFYLKHNCYTCYIVAAHLAGSGVENLYDSKYYKGTNEKTPVHETIGDTFHIDQYQYPPPFLLPPYFAYKAGLDFFQLRSIWFSLSVALFVLATGALTVWICGWRFHPLWLLWPILLVSPTTIATLQIGNVHAFIILISVLAMVLFEKGRYLLGGSLLAYATLSKLFPGFLILYLLLRREWRALAWTIGGCVALCLVTLLVFGMAPFRAFFEYQLPAIASGEAFGFAFKVPAAMLANSAIMGIPIKLDRIGIGVNGDPLLVARVATWIYTFVVLAMTFILAGRHRRVGQDGTSADIRLWMARGWVALLVLGQLRSPFLPAAYGNIAILLLLSLLLPIGSVGVLRIGAIGLGLLIFGLVVPLPFGPADSSFDFVFSMATMTLALIVALVVSSSKRPVADGSIPLGTETASVVGQDRSAWQ